MRKILASSTIGLLGEQINSVLKYLDRVEPQLYSSFWFKKVQQTLTPSKATRSQRSDTHLAQIQSEFAKDLAGLEEVENVEAKINKRYFSCHDSEQILHYHIERKLCW
ncbi:unnamed protein product [Oikopleura dioica]|uniref:Uncharacterized protein n=1 Tax=Oikopleura dioica TaxID=34765 RepID=E4Y0Q8_OIKDI|nr:unnamed protein product [Oikopleura dioica]